MLVPEIALTPQALGRFQARFGERIALLHSALTEAERRDERERIASGEARVVVGARSAVFAPVRGLGLIWSTRSTTRPTSRSPTRATTRGRWRRSGPRSRARSRSSAARRRGPRAGPRSSGSSSAAGSSVVSRRCASSTCGARRATRSRRRCSPSSGKVAEGGGKAILLLNRRGLAPAIHCRTCGVTRRCPNCDVALVLHADVSPVPPLRVHGSRRPSSAPSAARPSSPGSAPARSGSSASSLRAFPELELIRLDADTEDPLAALERFAAADRAVLLGTQMVAKGHHFAGVALAAVVDADTGMALPDFRAEERTFQLLTQLAGRSGRDAPGRVLVQTFQPDARTVELAARHDVEGFLAGELERRQALGYPPFRHLVRIVVSGREPEAPMRALEELKAALGGDELLGPAPILRLRGRHRAQLVAKTERPGALAARAAQALAAAAPAMRKAGLSVVVDVDPQ